MNTPTVPPFRVTLAGTCAARLQVLAGEAKRLGLAPRFAQFLRHMMESLEQRPREWGDPLSGKYWMQSVVYRRYVLSEQFRVDYAVHDTAPEVWVSAVEPLGGSPLAGS
jgi:hypothetical protein